MSSIGCRPLAAAFVLVALMLSVTADTELCEVLRRAEVANCHAADSSRIEGPTPSTENVLCADLRRQRLAQCGGAGAHKLGDELARCQGELERSRRLAHEAAGLMADVGKDEGDKNARIPQLRAFLLAPRGPQGESHLKSSPVGGAAKSSIPALGETDANAGVHSGFTGPQEQAVAKLVVEEVGQAFPTPEPTKALSGKEMWLRRQCRPSDIRGDLFVTLSFCPKHSDVKGADASMHSIIKTVCDTCLYDDTNIGCENANCNWNCYFKWMVDKTNPDKMSTEEHEKVLKEVGSYKEVNLNVAVELGQARCLHQYISGLSSAGDNSLGCKKQDSAGLCCMPSDHGSMNHCWYKDGAGNGRCRGSSKTWKLDKWGMQKENSASSKAKCLGRKRGHDAYCGTDSEWKFEEGDVNAREELCHGGLSGFQAVGTAPGLCKNRGYTCCDKSHQPPSGNSAGKVASEQDCKWQCENTRLPGESKSWCKFYDFMKAPGVVKNEGRSCFQECSNKAGESCTFCGGGACCKKGEVAPGCDGTQPAVAAHDGNHVCVSRPSKCRLYGEFTDVMKASRTGSKEGIHNLARLHFMKIGRGKGNCCGDKTPRAHCACPTPAPTAAPTTPSPTTKPNVALDDANELQSAGRKLLAKTDETDEVGFWRRRRRRRRTHRHRPHHHRPPTPHPTAQPTPRPTSTPTPQPTKSPTAAPTSSPTNPPTPKPTSQPTTPSPTEVPTPSPTQKPTDAPTAAPTTPAPTWRSQFTVPFMKMGRANDQKFGYTREDQDYPGINAEEQRQLNMVTCAGDCHRMKTPCKTADGRTCNDGVSLPLFTVRHAEQGMGTSRTTIARTLTTISQNWVWMSELLADYVPPVGCAWCEVTAPIAPEWKDPQSPCKKGQPCVTTTKRKMRTYPSRGRFDQNDEMFGFDPIHIGQLDKQENTKLGLQRTFHHCGAQCDGLGPATAGLPYTTNPRHDKFLLRKATQLKLGWMFEQSPADTCALYSDAGTAGNEIKNGFFSPYKCQPTCAPSYTDCIWEDVSNVGQCFGTHNGKVNSRLGESVPLHEDPLRSLKSSGLVFVNKFVKRLRVQKQGQKPLGESEVHKALLEAFVSMAEEASRRSARKATELGETDALKVEDGLKDGLKWGFMKKAVNAVKKHVVDPGAKAVKKHVIDPGVKVVKKHVVEPVKKAATEIVKKAISAIYDEVMKALRPILQKKVEPYLPPPWREERACFSEMHGRGNTAAEKESYTWAYPKQVRDKNGAIRGRELVEAIDRILKTLVTGKGTSAISSTDIQTVVWISAPALITAAFNTFGRLIVHHVGRLLSRGSQAKYQPQKDAEALVAATRDFLVRLTVYQGTVAGQWPQHWNMVLIASPLAFNVVMNVVKDKLGWRQSLLAKWRGYFKDTLDQTVKHICRHRISFRENDSNGSRTKCAHFNIDLQDSDSWCASAQCTEKDAEGNENGISNLGKLGNVVRYFTGALTLLKETIPEMIVAAGSSRYLQSALFRITNHKRGQFQPAYLYQVLAHRAKLVVPPRTQITMGIPTLEMLPSLSGMYDGRFTIYAMRQKWSLNKTVIEGISNVDPKFVPCAGFWQTYTSGSHSTGEGLANTYVKAHFKTGTHKPLDGDTDADWENAILNQHVRSENQLREDLLAINEYADSRALDADLKRWGGILQNLHSEKLYNERNNVKAFQKLPAIKNRQSADQIYINREQYQTLDGKGGSARHVSPPQCTAPWIDCVHSPCLSAVADHFPACKQYLTGSDDKATLFKLQLQHCGRLDGAPSCASRFKIDMNFCNTCCCATGLTKVNIVQELVHGSQRECGAWFTFTDTVVRGLASVRRSLEIMGRYTDSCFSSMMDAAESQ